MSESERVREMRAAAEAATGGEWKSSGDIVYTEFDKIIAGCWVSSRSSGECKANARYIALASPKNVLGLIAEVERLRATKPPHPGLWFHEDDGTIREPTAMDL